MFSVAVTPWHGLGTVLPEAPSTADAIRCAGLDWRVSTRRLYTPDGVPTECYATTRDTDDVVYGFVSDRYRPLQNSEAFGFFQPFLDAKQAKLETAGSLRGGSRVWVLASLALDSVDVRKGDAVKPFVLLSNSHDGVTSVRVGFTPIRVVCANTLAAAHDAASSKLLRVTHTANVVDALAIVRDTMNLARGTFEATATQYRTLAEHDVNEEDLRRYVDLVFAPKRLAAKAQTGMVLADSSPVFNGELMTDAEACASRVLDRVRALFEGGRGHELAGKTFWGAYNAITEYIGYERGSDANRLDSQWFGSGAALNKRALEVGLQLCA
jgi:phage/plasmid-like protein (TIGR03299 family)